MHPSFKIVHLHTDKKFIFSSVDFEGPEINNVMVWISNSKEGYSGAYHDSLFRFSKEKKDIDSILAICDDADLVVLYDLDNYKMELIKLFKKNTLVAWRFFGYELYDFQKSRYLSKPTQMLLKKKNKRINNWGSIKKFFISPIYLYLKKQRIKKAIKRCNLFLGMIHEEYAMLKKSWRDLPAFIQLPLLSVDEGAGFNFNEKKNSILLGNSRNFWNNHVDIINILCNHNRTLDYRVYLPFSYGDNGEYSKQIIHRVSDSASFMVLDGFMDINKYIALFHEIKAGLFNSYRQMALANIYYCLIFGVKIYLHPNNPTYDWLKKTGFFVFDINCFSDDLSSNNISLTEEQFLHNKSVYLEKSSKKAVLDFYNQILFFLERNKQ